MNLSIKMRHLKPKIPYGKTIKESEKPGYKPGKVKMQINTTIKILFYTHSVDKDLKVSSSI